MKNTTRKCKCGEKAEPNSSKCFGCSFKELQEAVKDE